MDNDYNDNNPAEVEPLTNWVNAPKVIDLKQDLTDAQPIHTNQINKIETWLDNLNITGKAKLPKSKTNSTVVPKVIRKQAEWRYAALSEPFLSTDDVFNIEPITAEDKLAAIQNALVLNNQFNTKINKVRLFDEGTRTLVNEGTVIFRVGWKYITEDIKVLEPTYKTVTVTNPTAVAQLTALGQATTRQIQTGEQEVTKTKIVQNCPTIEVCDSTNIIIDPSCQGEMDKARFVIQSFETSLAELRKEGDKYTNLDKIVAENVSALSTPDHATTDEDNFQFNDKPRKRIVAHEYWGFWDINNTGTVEPIVATWIGETMIRLEKNPMPDGKLPFVAVQYLPVKRSIYGEPDGELIEDNQKIVGAVTRGMIDIMAKSANGQIGSRKDALDVTNRRKFIAGLDYEFNGNVNPAEAFYMHKYPEIPQSAPLMLNMQNADAEALSGVKAFSSTSGLTSQSLGDSVGGIKSASDATAKRELGILRRLSSGIKECGRKIIAMNAVFLEEEEVVRVTNDQFVPVRRDDLEGNFDLSLSISTPEADNEKAQELSFMLQTIGNSMDPGMTKIILTDIANLRKMPALALKIKEYEPQPDPLVVQEQQLRIELLQQQIYNENAKGNENNANAALDNAKAVTEGSKARLADSQADRTDLDYLETESGVTQERKLEENNQKHVHALNQKSADKRAK